MYPPSILLLYQPLTLLPWVVSVRLFTLLNILFFGGIIFLIPRISIASFERIDWILLLFVFAGSKLVHLQLIAGQPFVSACFFGLLSILPACKENKWISGLALSLAMLKPTIALPFLLYLLYSRNYTSVLFCFFLTAVFNLSPFASMPFDTLSTYRMSFEQSFASGSINDYAYMNPCFQSLTDIRTIFYVLTNSRFASTVLKYVFLASLVGYLIVKRQAFFDDIPENILVAVTLISLWGLYHQALDMTSISVLFCVIPPGRLLCRWWGILVLAPLIMPTTGVYLRLKEYLPDMAYRLSVLDFHFSLICILVVWMVVMQRGWKVKS